MSKLYSINPAALRGALSMSTMTTFWAALGSATASARPIRISYAPAVPKDLPPNAGRRLVMSSLVTRESAFAGGGGVVWLRPLLAAALNVTIITTPVTHFLSVIGPPINRWIAAEFTPANAVVGHFVTAI